ncbi:MAG: GvpL/GvpF family gas vesicle protein [Bacteroidetes bacterium]|nr:GvpL/GvpF family gas vesicle protein [Bacteroidota bacterium]
MTGNLIYVYCIAEALPRETGRFEARGVKFVVSGGFTVIVKLVSEDGFSEANFRQNVSDIQWLEKNAREHIEVILMVMEQGAVIPFKFGTIYQTEASLKQFVADYSASLAENFLNIRGKEEWSVKIYCDRKALNEKIDELSAEAAAMEVQIRASSPGKAFLLGRKKNELIENEIDRLCKRYGHEYFVEFKNLSESTKISNLIPKEFTGREDTMILNATFLVDKSRVAGFCSVADALRSKGRNTGISVEATGPWPPFSFISIKEKQ